MTIKRISIGAIILSILIALCCGVSANGSDESLAIATEYFNCISEGRWLDLQQLLCDENQAEYATFISNSSNANNHIGYFNYAEVEIISCVVLSDAEMELSYVDKEKVNHYTSYQVVDCVVDVTAHRETSYLKTGYNRFMVFTACDSSGSCRIVEVLRMKDDLDSNSAVSTLSFDAPVAPSGYGGWEMPATINVRNYGEVNFLNYCYVVLMNEFGTDSYNENARKAMAMCVKQYGWNRTLVQKYPNYEYDVRENTYDQVYNPSVIPTAKVTAAVDAIWNYVMLTCDLKLFCSFYVKNSTTNSYAVYHGGMLSQDESNSLGNSGYTWQQILHYYYDYGTYNSEMTQGVISVVDLNHSAVGMAILGSGDMHYHYCNCTVCGCIHEAPHIWLYDGTYYTCKNCGKSTTIRPY